jgi:hypothetical protein
MMLGAGSLTVVYSFENRCKECFDYLMCSFLFLFPFYLRELEKVSCISLGGLSASEKIIILLVIKFLCFNLLFYVNALLYLLRIRADLVIKYV